MYYIISLVRCSLSPSFKFASLHLLLQWLSPHCDFVSRRDFVSDEFMPI